VLYRAITFSYAHSQHDAHTGGVIKAAKVG